MAILPKNLDVYIPLTICQECIKSEPVIESLYHMDGFIPPYDEYTQYRLTCKHLDGCEYAFKKGANK